MAADISSGDPLLSTAVYLLCAGLSGGIWPSTRLDSMAFDGVVVNMVKAANKEAARVPMFPNSFTIFSFQLQIFHSGGAFFIRLVLGKVVPLPR